MEVPYYPHSALCLITQNVFIKVLFSPLKQVFSFLFCVCAGDTNLKLLSGQATLRQEPDPKCLCSRKSLNNRSSLKLVPWRPIWVVNVEVCACSVTSVMLFATLLTVAHQVLLSMDSPGKNTGEYFSKSSKFNPCVEKIPGGRHGNLL